MPVERRACGYKRRTTPLLMAESLAIHVFSTQASHTYISQPTCRPSPISSTLSTEKTCPTNHAIQQRPPVRGVVRARRRSKDAWQRRHVRIHCHRPEVQPVNRTTDTAGLCWQGRRPKNREPTAPVTMQRSAWRQGGSRSGPLKRGPLP